MKLAALRRLAAGENGSALARELKFRPFAEVETYKQRFEETVAKAPAERTWEQRTASLCYRQCATA